MKFKPVVLVLALTAAVGAQAAQFDFSGDIATHKDVIQINFSLATNATDVRVWTDSFMGGVNFDPITAVWSQTNTGWSLLGQNDDNASIAPGQTRFDSGLTFANLTAGNYLFTIATYNNWASGTTLAQGFTFDNQAAIPLAQWNQPANHVNMGTHYSVHLSGVSSAVSAVPEAETYAMMLAGLGLLGAVTRRRNRKSALAA
ncbi:MAG: DVUA0089 family protein [Pseudomonadota bacterium]